MHLRFFYEFKYHCAVFFQTLLEYIKTQCDISHVCSWLIRCNRKQSCFLVLDKLKPSFHLVRAISLSSGQWNVGRDCEPLLKLRKEPPHTPLHLSVHKLNAEDTWKVHQDKQAKELMQLGFQFNYFEQDFSVKATNLRGIVIDTIPLI